MFSLHLLHSCTKTSPGLIVRWMQSFCCPQKYKVSKKLVVMGKGESKVITAAISLWSKQLFRSKEWGVSIGESGVKEALSWGRYPLLKVEKVLPFQNIKSKLNVTSIQPSWIVFPEHRATSSLLFSVSEVFSPVGVLERVFNFFWGGRGLIE